MALDALEREHLRKKMALKMGMFLEGGSAVSCVSGHFYEEPYFCELCQTDHGNEVLVIKNRAGKKMHVAASCLREMVRFRVTEAEDLPKWLEKFSHLKSEYFKRKAERELERAQERTRLEKKVIVRKRNGSQPPDVN